MIDLKLESKGGKLFAFFIDFVTAFPWVNHELLWIKSRKAGISERFINICKSSYNKAKVVVLTEDCKTSETDVSQGVMRGETMSSSLFNAFINDIIYLIIMFELKGIVLKMNTEIQALGFADDFVIFANDQQGVKKIEFMDKYCKENKLNLNIDKSKMVIFHKGNIKNYCFKYSGEKIEMVRNLKYLGIEYSNSGMYVRHFEKLSTNLRLAQNRTIQIIRGNNVEDWNVINQLFNTMVMNTMTYCSEIWDMHFLKKFDDLQANFYKKLLWLSRACPLAAVRVEFRLKHCSAVIVRRVLSWLDNVYFMNEERLPKICLDKMMKQKKDKRNWYYK